jgi:hypothetical protein
MAHSLFAMSMSARMNGKPTAPMASKPSRMPRSVRALYLPTLMLLATMNTSQRRRSDKGAGAERLCAGNGLFDDLRRFVDAGAANDGGWTTYYLMVAPNGAAELSRAMVEDGRFTKFIERLYLSDGSDLDTEPKLLDDDERVDEFDPKVARK